MRVSGRFNLALPTPARSVRKLSVGTTDTRTATPATKMASAKTAPVKAG